MTRRKSLAEFLSKALDQPGATQAGLARQLGVSRSTVQQWVSGKRPAPERYRASLRSAARGFKVTAPPTRVTKTGAPATTRATVTRKKLSDGREHVQTRARSTFAAELQRTMAAGQAPTSISVQLSDFRGADSPRKAGRSRRIAVSRLTPAELASLSTGSKAALEAVVTRAVRARRYSGGFTFDQATRFDFDTT